jgi:hypothetical protein
MVQDLLFSSAVRVAQGIAETQRAGEPGRKIVRFPCLNIGGQSRVEGQYSGVLPVIPGEP